MNLSEGLKLSVDRDKRRIRLLFDATLISEYYKKDIRRTGVYCVEFNLFNKMLESGRFDIRVYCRPEYISDLNKVLKSGDFAKSRLEIINEGNGICRQLRQICTLLEKPANNNKIIRIIRNRIIRVLTFFNSGYLGIKLKNDPVDAYFSAETAEIPKHLYENKGIIKFLFVHDLIPLLFSDYFGGNNKLKNHPVKLALEQLSVEKADIYAITNSGYTKKDLLKYVPGYKQENILVSHLACSEVFKKCDDQKKLNETRQKYGIPLRNRYILSLCSLEPRKNLVRAVDAFIQFIKRNDIKDICMVLCGSSWDDFISSFEKSIDDLGEYRKYIIKAGYADDEDVPVLYSGAEWFVYTSQYEGFGLPPLEAMSCGCPVITSNNSSLPEVVGDAGIMIDYDSVEQHIEAFEKMYYDKSFRNSCIEKGLKQAGKFSWDKCCETIEGFITDKLMNED